MGGSWSMTFPNSRHYCHCEKAQDCHHGIVTLAMSPLVRTLGLTTRHGTARVLSRRITSRNKLLFPTAHLRAFTSTHRNLGGPSRSGGSGGRGGGGSNGDEAGAGMGKVKQLVREHTEKSRAASQDLKDDGDDDEVEAYLDSLIDELDLEDDVEDGDIKDEKDVRDPESTNREIQRLFAKLNSLEDQDLRALKSDDDDGSDKAGKDVDVDLKSKGDDEAAISSEESTPSEDFLSDPTRGMTARDRAFHQNLLPEQQAEAQAALDEFRKQMKSPAFKRRAQSEMASIQQDIDRRYQDPPEAPQKFKVGFMAEQEEDDDLEDIGPDDEIKTDDISSLGHGELEQHREIREYARIIAWEMPLLSSEWHHPCLHHFFQLSTSFIESKLRSILQTSPNPLPP